MKIFLIVISILGAIFLYELVRMSLLVKKSSQLISHAVPYQQNIGSATSTMVIAVIGDSTAVGTGSDTPEHSVAGRLGALYPTATIINKGVNGQKTHELADHMNTYATEFEKLSRSQDKKIDMIVVQIGGNDILRLTDTDRVRDSLNDVLYKASTVSRKVYVMHTGNVGTSPFFPVYTRFIWEKRTRTIRDIFIDQAEKNRSVYVDLFKEKKDDVFAQDPETYYANDYVHPSGEGYGVWFEELKKQF